MKHLLKFDSPIHNLQVFLRTISRNIPEIPDVIPDGVYGEATQSAVKAFGKKFNINDDGVTDYGMWDKIVEKYKEIENQTFARKVRVFPETGLGVDSQYNKTAILVMQSMLRALSDQFSNIPEVNLNGEIDEKTTEAIKAFQLASGLNPTGEITTVFWNYLSAVYEAYISSDRVQNYNNNITAR